MSNTKSLHRWSADAQARAIKIDTKARSPISKYLVSAYRQKRLRSFVLRLTSRLEGGPMASQSLRCILKEYHGATVGDYSYGAIMTPGVLPPGSRVGRYCSVGQDLIVRRRNHPTDRPYMHAYFYNHLLGLLPRDSIEADSDNPLTISDDVWIGDRVTILGSCSQIGRGAVLAAGAVVTHDVAPYSIIGGVPARVLRQRFSDEIIDRLEATCWWQRSISDVITATDLPSPFVPLCLSQRP